MTANLKTTIAVTGAGGFVMRNAIDRLLGLGYRVIGIDRSFASAQGEKRQRPHRVVECIVADAADLPALTGVDTLVMGAAVTALPEELGISPEEHLRQNLLPMLHGLEWAQKHQVRRVIAVSSDALYAHSVGAMTEDMPPTPTSYYAIAKASTEAMFSSLHSQAHRDCVVMRLGSIYGDGESASTSRPFVSVVAQLIQQALNQGILQPALEAPRDWTFARDIGDALAALISFEKCPHALYNVTSSQIATPLEIARLIQHFLPQVQIVEATVSKRSASRQGWLSNERLRTEIGFHAWTPLEDGVRRLIALATHQTAKVSAL